MKRESEAEAKTEVRDSNSWIPNTSFTTVLSVVGIGLTIFDLYMRYRKGEDASEGASEGKSKAQNSRVGEKSSEAKVEVKVEAKVEAKEESVIEPVEKSKDTSSLKPSKKNTQNVRGQSSKIKCGMD